MKHPNLLYPSHPSDWCIYQFLSSSNLYFSYILCKHFTSISKFLEQIHLLQYASILLQPCSHKPYFSFFFSFFNFNFFFLLWKAITKHSQYLEVSRGIRISCSCSGKRFQSFAPRESFSPCKRSTILYICSSSCRANAEQSFNKFQKKMSCKYS